jgi:hypothetical protein
MFGEYDLFKLETHKAEEQGHRKHEIITQHQTTCNPKDNQP